MRPKYGNETCELKDFVQPEHDKSFQVQLALSLLLGVTAFLAFCVRETASIPAVSMPARS